MIILDKTYQQRAYEFVKSQILNLELKPGEFITDKQIADQLQISRTPIREAFRQIQYEGLLVYEARRGWRVYTLSLEDIHEIFDIKVSLESLIARKAAGCNDRSLQNQLKHKLELLRQAANDNNLDSWIEIDEDLHATIFEMANNDRAHKIIENINDQWHRVRIGFIARTEHLGRSYQEHEAIIAAILEGRPEEAEQFMIDHLNNVRAELVSLLINMVLPFVKEGV